LKYKSAIKRSYCLFIDDEYNRSKIANRVAKVDTLLCGGEKEILDFGDSFETLAEMCELEHLDVLFDRQEIKASVPICRKFRFDRITIIELHCEEDIYINGVNTEAKVLNFVSIDGVDWKSHIAKSNGQNFELILQESQNNEFQKIEIYSA
jgi:hypothetical protein